jgi:dihydrofolate reductase
VVSKLRFSISMSVDGYVAGPDQSLQDPLGKRGEELHEWVFSLSSWQEAHGGEGGDEDPVDARFGDAWSTNTGAYIMGRNMFGPVRGTWESSEPWHGWWGEDPPYHTPVFVLTHHAREPLEMAGGTTFHFVTDGIEAALERARAAAGDRDVSIGGGASTVQQYLRAGLVDEMQLHVSSVLLGAGERLFDDLGGGPHGFECVELVSSARVTHYTYVRS